MKRSPTLFLQAVIVLLAVGALTFLVWEPHLEGRNVGATPFQIYFNDPFLAYAYTGSICFFVALYNAFKLLGYIGQNQVFSTHSIKALKRIKHCALSLIGFIVGAEIYIVTFARGKDDIAGGVVMGLGMMFCAAIIATSAAIFERLLQSAVEMKSENDLTI